jgi:hypothetical protein
VEQRAMMLAAVEAMAKTDPVRASRRDDADVAAQATAVIWSMLRLLQNKLLGGLGRTLASVHEGGGRERGVRHRTKSVIPAKAGIPLRLLFHIITLRRLPPDEC